MSEDTATSLDLTEVEGPEPNVDFTPNEVTLADEDGSRIVIDSTNATTGIITEPTYEPDGQNSDSLRVIGGIRAEWGGGSDFIQADFNVLLNGPDDIGANGTTRRTVFE
ncbi:MAG: hypothetical protein KC561_00505 [Myxococcales bacterium]|nr:hypothetical protein [Myxococcales bacterium]